MIKPNLFTSPVPLGEAKSPLPEIKSTPLKKPGTPRTQVVPLVDEAYEKKQFIKTMGISFAVFSVISVALVGMAVYAKMSQGDTSSTPTRLIRQDDAGLRVVSASEPTPVPTSTPVLPTSVPTPGVGGYSVPIITGTVITVPVISGVSVTVTPTRTPTISGTIAPTTSISVTPTPTSVLYMSTESTSNQINFGNVPVNTEITSEVTIRNIGSQSLTINSMFFSTVGATNPFIIQSGSAATPCLTNSDLPYTLSSNVSRCILFKYTPSSTSINSNIFLLYWNTGLAKSITLSGTVTTPTLTPTATPTPAGNFYISSDATSGQIDFGTILQGATPAPEVQITLHNVDNVPLNISHGYFATTGTVSPYTITAGDDSCWTTFTQTLAADGTACLRFVFNPTSYTVNTNYFLLYWNSRLLKSIKLTGAIITPTPLPTPT
jgi:hypothetical protein